jgi:hypothetical protein
VKTPINRKSEHGIRSVYYLKHSPSPSPPPFRDDGFQYARETGKSKQERQPQFWLASFPYRGGEERLTSPAQEEAIIDLVELEAVFVEAEEEEGLGDVVEGERAR